MINCVGQCQREADGEDAYLSLPVEQDEWVCRSIRPTDFNKTGAIKSSFVSSKELKLGQLSAWRLDSAAEIPVLAKKLEENKLPHDNIVAVQARVLREKIDEFGRLFCIINDTRTTEHGDHDPQHIAISPCKRFLDEGIGEDLLSTLKTELNLAYRCDVAVALYQPA